MGGKNQAAFFLQEHLQVWLEAVGAQPEPAPSVFPHHPGVLVACHSPAKTGARLLEYSTAFVSRRGLSRMQGPEQNVGSKACAGHKRVF